MSHCISLQTFQQLNYESILIQQFYPISDQMSEEGNQNIEICEQIHRHWSSEEHLNFLRAVFQFGQSPKEIEKIVKTRTTTQIRTHSQKFFKKVKEICCSRKRHKQGRQYVPNQTQIMIQNMFTQLDLTVNTPKDLALIVKNQFPAKTRTFKIKQEHNEEHNTEEKSGTKSDHKKSDTIVHQSNQEGDKCMRAQLFEPTFMKQHFKDCGFFMKWLIKQQNFQTKEYELSDLVRFSKKKKEQHKPIAPKQQKEEKQEQLQD